MIFQGKVKDLNLLQNSIVDLKHFFKTNCRVVVNELHTDDNEELLESITLELEKHHSYWAKVFKDITDLAHSTIGQF